MLVLVFILLLRCIFFFSSRRRHTRWPRDWSSDVCSSDLEYPAESRSFYDVDRQGSENSVPEVVLQDFSNIGIKIFQEIPLPVEHFYILETAQSLHQGFHFKVAVMEGFGTKAPHFASGGSQKDVGSTPE